MRHGRRLACQSGARRVIGGLIPVTSSLIGGGVTAWACFPFALRAGAAFSPILRPLGRSFRSVQGERQSPARWVALDGCRSIRSGLGTIGFGGPLVLPFGSGFAGASRPACFPRKRGQAGRSCIPLVPVALWFGVSLTTDSFRPPVSAWACTFACARAGMFRRWHQSVQGEYCTGALPLILAALTAVFLR